ncbi:MAG: HAD family hydrolase [Candidatus Hydrogenedentes bacterium]|nr:HAD family hydrolase [Candidatus Hydrogenedentota bacterium]
MAIRAITFDFWRTLFHDACDPARRRRIRIDALCAAAGVTPERAEDALRRAEHDFLLHHINEKRTLGPEDAVDMTARTLGVTITGHKRSELAKVFAEAILYDPPTPIPGAFDAVQTAARTHPVGVVSDSGISPGRSLRVLLDQHGFTKYFGALAFSDEVGVAKPQAAMFETAARHLRVAPHELLHIGDLELTDVAGAKGVGAKTALFAGDNAKYRETTSADYIFTDWSEFIQTLPSLR